MKKRLLIISMIICAGVLACIGFAADLWFYANNPISANPEKIVVHLKPGQSFARTTEILEAKGLINSPFRFNLISRFKGYDKKVQAGEYLLSETMTPLHILEKMAKGEVKLYKLTIPEGLNIYQIAELASEGGFAENAAFIKVATDSAYASEKGIEARTLDRLHLAAGQRGAPRGQHRSLPAPRTLRPFLALGLRSVIARSVFSRRGDLSAIISRSLMLIVPSALEIASLRSQ